MSSKSDSLKIHNASENNLKGISLELPHDTFTVVTGLSGSGKSSLAFDTVYAEGQRRYIETFSPYTRQFFDKVKKPEVDLIENVRPAIAIQQRTRILSSRSTVGSMTNLNDYFKILWSNLAQPFCPSCGDALRSWDAMSLAEFLLAKSKESAESRFLICAKITFAQKKTKKVLREEIERLRILGFSRFLNPDNFETRTFEEGELPPQDKDGSVFVALDRVRNASSDAARIKDSIEQAFSLSSQFATIASTTPSCIIIEQTADATSKLNTYYRGFTCQNCNKSLERARPALFSFNHPIGACPTCNGFGRVLRIDEVLCVPNPSLSIEKKALQCWASEGTKREYRKVLSFCAAQGISVTAPWYELSEAARELIFAHKSRDFIGVRAWFKHLERKIYKMHVRVFLAKYRGQFECPECHGTRLKEAALAYRINGKKLPDIFELPIGELYSWVFSLCDNLDPAKYGRELREVLDSTLIRLTYLRDLGLNYLTLNRQARTLSGGETQRVNLATALGSELISTHFVLDEPSVGLHARDTERLIRSIKNLKDKGNSLLVVEHDLACLSAADQIIEVGPKAGEGGGEIVYSGPAAQWLGFDIDPMPDAKVRGVVHQFLNVKNATARNLKALNFKIPLNQFVCLSGVSGSGKSTLVNEVLKNAYERSKIQTPENEALTENLVSGFEHVEQVLLIDQSPLAKSPRGNIATYTGIWDFVRELLSNSDQALSLGLSKSAFSFNVDGGRCPVCKGAGFIREDMQFLSDVYLPCDVCLGKRFQPSVLSVEVSGKSVHDFLNMTIHESILFFKESPAIVLIAQTLEILGLGHITLGHPLSELSGGEAQRLKLVPFIAQSSRGRSLLIFDEPTTGLHFKDVQNLIKLLRVLVSKGHSVLCVEHNLSVIAACDWVIDLGPESGHEGGEIVIEGTPQDFITAASKAHCNSFTAKYLAESEALLAKATHFSIPQTSVKERILKTEAPQVLSIRGAREHNLKNVDVDIPLGKFVALCGVSGSGKSSIAKDIIYAEGQRRYLDCLSPYARQFIKELKKPEIVSISNVKPTVCVYQHTFQPSRLSTVGTMSEIYNYLRLLYVKTGTQHCPDHPEYAISPATPQSISAEIKSLKAKMVRILAPVIKKKKGNHRAVLERAISSEIDQIRVDGVFLAPGSVSMSGGLEKNKAHSIDFVVARFNPATLELDLIQEAVSQALGLAAGTLVVVADKNEIVFSMDRSCPVCKRGFFKPDPEDLSFSSKRGACEKCLGAGVDEHEKTCKECGGARLNALGRHLLLGSKNIFEVGKLTAPKLLEFLRSLSISSTKTKISNVVLNELEGRIHALGELGLEYLDLNRSCTALSGGELQRLRLAAAIGSPLSGVMYIFDEPSAGLHPIDNFRVLERLQKLRDENNSVLMIEHDAESIRSAEYVIDVGPGGGSDGGNIVFSGTQKDFIRSKTSPTSLAIQLQESRPPQSSKDCSSLPQLRIQSGSCHNIESIKLDIPQQALVTVAGVSGAGKSSLVHGIISDSINLGTHKDNSWKWKENSLVSDLPIDRLLLVDQKPIGINSRSTPASYLGIWDHLRGLFAQAVDAKARGWGPSFFSYNTGKGRCAGCKGQGQIKLEMSFLPDAFIECEHCNGTRFSEEAKSIRYLDLTISEVLALTFDEARIRFANHRKVHQPLQQACELGLGYLTLGQSSSTLSGGESQRIKLVSELNAERKGHTLYVLDEPTTGLHKSDVERLLKTLRSLVARGNSVIVIEHDSDIILGSDYILELGPGPGKQGGKVIFKGSPTKLCEASTPWGAILGTNLRKGYAA